MLQRALSGLLYMAVIVFCVHPGGSTLLGHLGIQVFQGWLFFGLMTLFMVGCAWEAVRMMRFEAGSYHRWLVLPLTLFAYYIFAKRFFTGGLYFDFRLSEILSIVLVGIAALTVFKFPNELYYDNGKMIFVPIYVAIPFGLALGLPKVNFTLEDFGLEIFYLFILIWSSDTFAYLAGKFLGKHKMAPKISPKKTWEGFAGGVLLTLLFSYFIEAHNPDLRGNWMMVGFLVSVFGPLGDLVESQLKRNFGVKDSGNIIPGHGGVLDRLDSFLLCVPAVYLYFILEKFF